MSPLLLGSLMGAGVGGLANTLTSSVTKAAEGFQDLLQLNAPSTESAGATKSESTLTDFSRSKELAESRVGLNDTKEAILERLSELVGDAIDSGELTLELDGSGNLMIHTTSNELAGLVPELEQDGKLQELVSELVNGLQALAGKGAGADDFPPFATQAAEGILFDEFGSAQPQITVSGDSLRVAA